MKKEDLKRIACFLGLVAYAIGIAGGIGYTIYCKAWVVAICLPVVAWMAVPTVKDWFKTLVS